MQRRTFLRSLVALVAAPFIPTPVRVSNFHTQQRIAKSIMFGTMYGADHQRLLQYCKSDAELTMIALAHTQNMHAYIADKIFPPVAQR